MLGDAAIASKMSDRLLKEGIYVVGFSFPVVPKGLARIRTQMSAAHELYQLDKALAAFEKVGKEFLQLEYNWLKSERLMRDPAAADKLVDLEAMLDFHRNYYRSSNDTANLKLAENGYLRVKQLQREMKEKMEFLFRPQGK